MNWWNILKNAKLSNKPKGLGTLDTSKIKIDTDDKCKKRLTELIDEHSFSAGRWGELPEKTACHILQIIEQTDKNFESRFIQQGKNEGYTSSPDSNWTKEHEISIGYQFAQQDGKTIGKYTCWVFEHTGKEIIILTLSFKEYTEWRKHI